MKQFVVVVASFNNAAWYRENLESILTQNYPRFRVLYVDDASTDGTAELVSEYLHENTNAQPVEFFKNDVRMGPLANIDRMVRLCDPEEIVVLVDGDDFLAHAGVLARLNAIYQDPDVWLTWGQFARVPQDSTEAFCAPIPSDVVSANAFRDFPFVSSHLRTFYAGLYHRISLADLTDDGGQFYRIAGDVAQMFAMHELAGPHGRFVAEVLYKYNRANPLNDDKLDRARQIRTENEIREKARYGRLSTLQGTNRPREVCFVTGAGRSLFGVSGPLAEADWWRRPFRQLRSVLNRLGYTVREATTPESIGDPHRIVVFDVRTDELEQLERYSNEDITLVLWKDQNSAPENFDAQVHARFKRVYTWSEDLIDDQKIFRFRLPFLRPMIRHHLPFEDRRLCALVVSNRSSDRPGELFSEERKVAEFLAEEQGDAFDLFSSGWSPTTAQTDWGIVPTQLDCLRRFRFAFCYEPTRCKGLITAKIFDCFAAGCVPIYLGSPNIDSWIPPDCFIAREQFGSEADVYAYLRTISSAAHEEYLARIRAFLSSEAAIAFSGEHFVKTFVGLVKTRAASGILQSGSGKQLRNASDRTSETLHGSG
jgi:glycosyltransferase involved in cell wall biosynthesis